MPLPSDASMKDVIEKMQELTGINQKSELAAVLGSPSLSTDTMTKLINDLQNGKDTMATNITAKGVTASPSDTFPILATKIGQISIGKKWASGTIATSGQILTVPLSFKPKIIIIRHETNVNRFGLFDGSNSANSTFQYLNGTVSFATFVAGDYVNTGGFKITLSTLGAGTYKWLAYEE